MTDQYDGLTSGKKKKKKKSSNIMKQKLKDKMSKVYFKVNGKNRDTITVKIK